MKTWIYSFTTLALAVLIFGVISACTEGEAAKAKPNYLFKDGGKPGIVAKIGNEEVNEDELMGDDKMSFFDLKRKEYDLRINALNQLLVKKLVGAEAKAKGMDLETYVNKVVTKGEIKVSPSEYNKFVEEKHIPAAQINDQLKERINSYLKEQRREDMINNYIAALTKKTPVEVYFKKPKMNVQVDVAAYSPTFGPKDSSVTIVEFSDFQCPFCSRAAETVTQLKKKYGSKVKFAFRHFPLPMHKDARPAAEASMCVNEQGADKFWKFHDAAFKAQDKLDAAGLEAAAKVAGADLKKFKDCVASKKFAAQVDEDTKYGEKIGVRSTPTFFVNGQMLAGALPIDQFSETIEEELADAKKK